jgi:hypothetical protein
MWSILLVAEMYSFVLYISQMQKNNDEWVMYQIPPILSKSKSIIILSHWAEELAEPRQGEIVNHKI